MEWKLIEAGVWGCEGTDVTVHYLPETGSAVPYRVRWHDKDHGYAADRDEIFKRAESFIDELVSAGIDA
jgi:hypothetical protein